MSSANHEPICHVPPVAGDQSVPHRLAADRPWNTPSALLHSPSLLERRQGGAVSTLVIPKPGEETGGQDHRRAADVLVGLQGPPQPDGALHAPSGPSVRGDGESGGHQLAAAVAVPQRESIRQGSLVRIWAEMHGLEGPDSSLYSRGGAQGAEATPSSKGSSGTGTLSRGSYSLPPLLRVWRSLTRRPTRPLPFTEGSAPEKPWAARMADEERLSQALSPSGDPGERLLLAQGARRISSLQRMRSGAWMAGEETLALKLDRLLRARAVQMHPRASPATPRIPMTAPAAAWPGAKPIASPVLPTAAARLRFPLSGPLPDRPPIQAAKHEPARSPLGLTGPSTLKRQNQVDALPTPKPEVSRIGLPLPRGAHEAEDDDGAEGSADSGAASAPSAGLSSPSAESIPAPPTPSMPQEESGLGSSGRRLLSTDVAPPATPMGYEYVPGVEALGPIAGSGRWVVHGLSDGDGVASPGAWRGQPLDACLHSLDMRQLMLGPQVAAGTYGRVYCGQYRKREVAVKVLRVTSSQEASDTMAEQFVNEVALLSQLEHPNIVKFEGAFCRPPVRVVAMEFLSGGPVRKWLRMRREERIPPLQLIDMATDIANGMAYLHTCRIVHRDLKTENLLFAADGTIKVADFGEAVALGAGGRARGEVGTYRWMAPEVSSGKAYGCSADVYSFALVLWELLTLRLPFEEMSGIQAAYAVVAKDLRPSIPSHAPPGLAALMSACWAGNPKKRPSFAEVLLRLARTAAEVEQSDEEWPQEWQRKRCCC